MEQEIKVVEEFKSNLQNIQVRLENLDKILSERIEFYNTVNDYLNIGMFFFIIYFVYKAIKDTKKLKETIRDKEELLFKQSIFVGLDILCITIIISMCFYGFSEKLLEIILKIIPITMGGIALTVGYLNFARKSNAELEYLVSFDDFTSSTAGKMKFSLLNLKDRNIILYGIYIKFENVSLLLPHEYPHTLSAYAHLDIEIENIVGFKIEENTCQVDFKIIKKNYNFERFYPIDLKSSEYDGDEIINIIRQEAYQVVAITNLGTHVVKKKIIDTVNSEIKLSIVTEKKLVEEMQSHELNELYQNPDQPNVEQLEKEIYEKQRPYFSEGVEFTLKHQVNFKKQDGKYKIYPYSQKD